MVVVELRYGSVRSMARAQCSGGQGSAQQIHGVALSAATIAVLLQEQLLLVPLQVCPVRLLYGLRSDVHLCDWCPPILCVISAFIYLAPLTLHLVMCACNVVAHVKHNCELLVWYQQVAPVTLASVIGALSIDCRFPVSDSTAHQLAARSALRPEALRVKLRQPDYRFAFPLRSRSVSSSGPSLVSNPGSIRSITVFGLPARAGIWSCYPVFCAVLLAHVL